MCNEHGVPVRERTEPEVLSAAIRTWVDSQALRAELSERAIEAVSTILNILAANRARR